MARKSLLNPQLALLRERRWTKADARVVLDALARCGDSVAAFARAHKLSAKKIFWWRSRLADEPRPDEPRPDEPETLSFAPVVVTGLGRKPTAVIRRGAVEIEVLEPDAVEPSWLAAVLRATDGGEA